MTHQRLTDIVITGLGWARDIAACRLTSQLYVADSDECVWRVSSDGVDMQLWLTTSPSDMFRSSTLSVTSSRLLVTSRRDRQLRQFDAAGGDELRRVGLPDYMVPLHAVESPTGTFIVGHRNPELYHITHSQVSEVSTEGQVLRQFCGPLHWDILIAVDSRGNILVPDSGYHRILLLDAQLELRRVIINKRQLNGRRPEHLCYVEQSGQLLVGFYDRGVGVFHMLRR